MVLLVALAAVAIWQRNNIEAVLQYTQNTHEELEQQMVDNDRLTQELLEEALQAAQKVDKELAELEKPEHSPSPTPEPTPTESVPPAVIPDPTLPPQAPESTPTPTPVPTPEPDSYEAKLKNIVDRVYALKDEYLVALDTLQAEAIAAYKAIPSAERKGKALADFVSEYISKGTALEKECDGKMDALMAELEELLKAYGQSLDLVDAVKYTYAQEKSLKKAWYMSELERRGFI